MPPLGAICYEHQFRTLSVGLVDKACTEHAQPALNKSASELGQENFRFVIRIAERRGFPALVVNLPIGSLR